MIGRQLLSGAAGAGAQGISATLEPARQMFRDLVIERVMAFEALRKLAAESDHPQREMAKIADIAHKISGVAATLGFFKVGELASVLDRSIPANPTKPADPGYFRRKVEPLLEALLVEMEALLDD